MGSTPNQSRSAIIFVADGESRAFIVSALATLGINTPIIASEESVCIDELHNNPSSWLIIDMGAGLESVVRILIAAQGSSPFDVTPIFLLTADAGYKNLCIAIEYNVCKVMMGQMHEADALSCLKALSVIVEGNKKLAKVTKELHALRKAAKWKEAINLISSEIDGPIKNPALVIEQAENYFLSGDMATATTLMGEMIVANPNDLRAVHMMSRILLAQKKVPEAIELLNQAEKKNQYSAARLIALGDCYLQMGKYRQARSKFNTALALDESRVEAKQGLMQAELLTGNMDEAIQLGRSLGGNIDIAKILNMTAIIAIHNKNLEDGLKMYEQSIALLSAHPVLGARVWFNLGLNHTRAGDLPLALKCFETACELDPGFAGAAQNRRVLGNRIKTGNKEKTPVQGENKAAAMPSEVIYDAHNEDDLCGDDSEGDHSKS